MNQNFYGNKKQKLSHDHIHNKHIICNFVTNAQEHKQHTKDYINPQDLK